MLYLWVGVRYRCRNVKKTPPMHGYCTKEALLGHCSIVKTMTSLA